MTIDLESSLDQMARSVHDDAVADRMNGQVHRMVAQIRRRRAARYTATGVVSVGAVAAVAFGALRLADPTAPEPVAPATEGSDGEHSYDVTGLNGRYVCGEVAPEPPEAPDDALVLEGRVSSTVAYGDPVPLELSLINFYSMSVNSYSEVDIAVLSDGVVVGTSGVSPLLSGLMTGSNATGEAAATIVACGGDSPLDGGEYQMVASITLGLADGISRTATTEPMPFTIGANPLGAVAEDAAEQARAIAEGREAVAEIVASARERADSFPVCGSVVESSADALLALDLPLEDRVFGRGESFTTEIPVRATRTLPDGVQLLANAAQVVLTRDGVVVGRGSSFTDAVPIDLGPDGTGSVTAVATFTLCSVPGADAPEVDLPPGTYQAQAVFTLTFDEAAVDGEETTPWEPVVVSSEAVDVVIDAPTG